MLPRLQSSTDSIYQLGIRCERGAGVTPDAARAGRLYSIAAALGHTAAASAVIRLHVRGPHGPPPLPADRRRPPIDTEAPQKAHKLPPPPPPAAIAPPPPEVEEAPPVLPLAAGPKQHPPRYRVAARQRDPAAAARVGRAAGLRPSVARARPCAPCC